jgi:hypothetical protein
MELEHKFLVLNKLAGDLRSTLVDLDDSFDLYYNEDGEAIESMGFFTCKSGQQDALRYANEMIKILKSLENN